MRRLVLPILVAGAGIAGAVAAQTDDADIAAGEAAYQEVCRNCHGPKAQGLASYPELAGKDAEYLADRLKTYRAGERIGPNSMLMIPHAQELSDQEIADISAYIAQTFE